MNKNEIDALLPKAYNVLDDVGIVETKNNTKVIVKTYRGLISSFGAAITMGSLLSACAFFADKGSSSVDRTKIERAIEKLIGLEKDTNLFMYVSNQIKNNKEAECTEEVINAAIALKLAMNLYELKKPE